jgi:hypothetical protein
MDNLRARRTTTTIFSGNTQLFFFHTLLLKLSEQANATLRHLSLGIQVLILAVVIQQIKIHGQLHLIKSHSPRRDGEDLGRVTAYLFF